MKRIANILYCLTISAIIVSCAAPKSILDDHVNIQIKTNTDSLETGSKIIVQHHAEASNENSQHFDSVSSSQTSLIAELTFIPEGGTYNPQTGNLTGITSAKLQADINRLNRTINNQNMRITRMNDSITTLQDSLTYYRQQTGVSIKEDSHEEHDTPSRPFGWKFCVICTILFWSLITIIACGIYIRWRTLRR